MQHFKKTSLLGKIVKYHLINNLEIEMPCQHITPNQRNELSALLIAKIKKKDIAKQLGKHRITIWRELQRNGTNNQRGYDAKIAKEKTKTRRIKANQRFRKIDNDNGLKRYIIKKLKQLWSPEQIAGRLRYEYGKTIIGKDSIYQFIYKERKDLVKYLRCQKGNYRRRYGTRIREKQREEAKKKRIDTRPVAVELKQRLGDWEGDTVIGQDRKPAILTHVDRKSGLLLADKLERATSELTRQKIVTRFDKIPRSKKHTITYDNGSEFSEHKATEEKTKIDIYFAYPYHSWERGCNENANGLLRQFFPKKSIFATIRQEQIQSATRLINHRPRKRLNYLTPYEVFYEKTKRCTLE